MAFEELVGNEKIKNLLTNTVNHKNILHSYLFIGEEGIGKQQFAKEFAGMILCQTEDKKPCGKCKACIEFDSDNNPDFMQIEPEGNGIKIEQIRMMQSKIAEKPINSEKKVYIINDSETMTKEAQNCLLKTLEEPPSYITIILITSNENAILNTIKSRCMKVAFQRIENEQMKQILEKKFEIQPVTNTMLEMVGGSIKKALLLKDKKELYHQVEQIMEKIEQRDVIDTIKEAEQIYQNKEDIYDILDYINVLLFQKAKDKPAKSSRYLKAMEIVEKTKKRLKANSNFDMSIDFLLIPMWEELNK